MPDLMTKIRSLLGLTPDAEKRALADELHRQEQALRLLRVDAGLPPVRQQSADRRDRSGE